MHVTVTSVIYLIALPFWLFVWWQVRGLELQRREPMLWLPFFLAPLFLILNLWLILDFGEVGSVTYEESRFNFIQDRALIAVQATASVLIVAVLVYGLTVRKVPIEFIRFMLYAFIFLLGLMSPVIWLPIESPGMFFILRHFQGIALIFSLFLCVGGIIILLRDIMNAGGVAIDLSDEDSNRFL